MLDILPPTPPSVIPWIEHPAILILFLVITGSLIWWLKREPRPTLYRLGKLAARIRTGAINPKPAAERLTDEIRHVFKLKHIRVCEVPGEMESAAWQSFIDQLQALRFSQATDQDVLLQLIHQLRQWVLQHGR